MLFNIQILRGIAAILVIWVHAQEIMGNAHIPHELRQIGFGGVDLFFVISGFIIVHSTSRRDMAPGYFFAKRLLRVAPLYYVFTSLVIVICIFFPSIFKSTAVDLASIYKSFLFIPFQKSADRIYPIYFLGWTLNYEMFFYALYAVALFFRPEHRVPGVVGLLLVLACAGRFIATPEDYGVIAYFYTRPVILDFVLGMTIAVCAFRTKADAAASGTPYFYFAFVLGCLCFAFFGYLLPESRSSVAPPTDTFLRFGLPAAIIVAAAVWLEKAGCKIGNTLMRRLGDASYSIYLAHYLAVGFLAAIIANVLHGDVTLTIAAIATMAAAVGFGVLTYQVVERPLSGDFRHLLWLVGQRAEQEPR